MQRLRNNCRLFDDFVRTNMSPSKYAAASSYMFLNDSAWRNAGRIRDLLEGWAEHYPEKDRCKLQERFRNYHHHEATFFELTLHELFLLLGYRVTVEPECAGTSHRPDFHVSPRRGKPFLVEATTSRVDSVEDRGQDVLQHTVYDVLNQIKVWDYFFTLHPRGKLKKPPELKKIKQTMEAELNALDYDFLRNLADLGKTNCFPSVTLRQEGWRLEVKIWPRPVGLRGRADIRSVGGSSGGPKVNRVERAIRATLHRKASRYGYIREPFVIAINLLNTSVEHEDVINALFGDMTTDIVSNRSKIERSSHRRKLNGFLTPTKHTRVSGVIVGRKLWPHSIASAEMIFYRNPWAANVADCDMLDMGQCVTKLSDGRIRHEYTAGRTLRELMGIDVDWPGEK